MNQIAIFQRLYLIFFRKRLRKRLHSVKIKIDDQLLQKNSATLKNVICSANCIN
jgi:hypothetical protein